METQEILFALFRSAICGEKLHDGVIAACTPEALDAVYDLAVRHELAHL